MHADFLLKFQDVFCSRRPSIKNCPLHTIVLYTTQFF